MKTIAIDARESGTSTGRYIDKLVENLHKLAPKFKVIILAHEHRLEYLRNIAPDFEVVECTYKEFTFEEQLGFKKQLDSLGADLVHFGMVQQPIRYKGKVVTTIHDLITVRFKNPKTNPVVFTAKQQVYKQVIKKAVKKSETIITGTEFVKQDLINFTGARANKFVVTLESADKITDSPAPVSGLKKNEFIMYVGRPLPHKNLGRFMESFVEISKTHPNLKLVLAGKKDVLFEKHKERAKQLGISDKVVFTGFVSEGQLRWLYENTACYVFPSLSEGFGLPGLEAMVHGAPVASSNATCLPEVYGDAAQYFDPLDVTDMASKISQVLDHPTLANELRVKGTKQAAKYSWKRMATQTLAVYNQALS